MSETKNRPSTYRSPSVPMVNVSGFWADRQKVVRERTAEILFRRAEEAGVMIQFDLAKQTPPYAPPFGTEKSLRRIFWDSDVAKIIETVGFLAASAKVPALEEKVDRITDLLEKLQLEDGYLNSWFIRYDPASRWTNIRDCHEMYCAGHLLEGAIAYYQATGKDKLLRIVRRYIHHIMDKIGPGPGQLHAYPGHEELELALVKLYHLDGDRRYLDFAKYLIDERGRTPKFYEEEAKARGETENLRASRNPEYNQSHHPVREQDKVVGHAVRAMYLYCGMADVALETGDAELRLALDRLWDDLTLKRLYVTGGLGPNADNEGFTSDYDLPNQSAYAETCAAIGLVFWAQRMLRFEPNSRYADLLEQAVYNGALAGLSLDGTKFFYDNPLESDGSHRRWDWHRCPCCPPNIARLIASIGTYFYGYSDAAVAVHLYGESEGRFPLGSGEVRLRQRTRYPWEGAVECLVGVAEPRVFALQFRIPGWAGTGASISVNGTAIDLAASVNKGYATIRREWRDGDTVRLELPMPVRRVYAYPGVKADAGRVALQRGPLVYCLEKADNPPVLARVVLAAEAEAKERFEENLLGGVTTLTLPVALERLDDWKGVLYRGEKPQASAGEIKAIPYYAWANREPGEMLVWLRRS